MFDAQSWVNIGLRVTLAVLFVHSFRRDKHCYVFTLFRLDFDFFFAALTFDRLLKLS